MLSFHVDRNNIDKMRDYWDAIFKEDPEYRVLIARSVVVRDRSMGMLMINKVVNKNSPEYELLMDAVSISNNCMPSGAILKGNQSQEKCFG